MGTFAITGSSGGIGSATRTRLEAEGHQVIGVDLRDAEVIADLSTTSGRADMIAAVEEMSGGVLDGVVAGAGVSSTGANESLVVSLNSFSAIATLDSQVLVPACASSRLSRSISRAAGDHAFLRRPTSITSRWFSSSRTPLMRAAMSLADSLCSM